MCQLLSLKCIPSFETSTTSAAGSLKAKCHFRSMESTVAEDDCCFCRGIGASNVIDGDDEVSDILVCIVDPNQGQSLQD
jgi:hypothetical protein